MYIYFIRAGSSGPIKIGVAVDVDRRLNTLQTGNALQLTIIAKIKCRSKSEAYDKESQLHKMFRKKKIRGEWFHGNIRLNQLAELKESERQSIENDFVCRESDIELIKNCPF